MKTTLIVLAALAANLSLAQTPNSPPSSPLPLASQNGRYAFGRVTESNRDVYLLDTQTGRLWQATWDKDGQPLLKQVAFLRADGTTAFFPENDGKNPFKPQFKGDQPGELPGMEGKPPVKPKFKLDNLADPSLPPQEKPLRKDVVPPR